MNKRLNGFLLLLLLTVAFLSFGCGQAFAGSVLKVHFLDVGQADSILVQLPNGENMLIDAGNSEDEQTVVAYIKKQGVKRLDYIVATHPHEDHIGGIYTIIKSFAVGKIFAPRVTNNTTAFENFLLAVKSKGLKITPAVKGLQIIDQPSLKATFLAPCGQYYEDLNQWSAVVKITYGKTSYLFTGDAGHESEQEMLASGANLKADVLKVGHHGSRHSTSLGFLKAVSPKYAVISVGAGNDYGHPHQETLNVLANSKTKVYRTDINGTIISVSNGKTVSFAVSKNVAGQVMQNTTSTPATAVQGYIGNKNSKKFHRPTCRTLPALQNRVYFKTREEAIKAGYVPCKICKP